jgi:hypothetical protein
VSVKNKPTEHSGQKLENILAAREHYQTRAERRSRRSSMVDGSVYHIVDGKLRRRDPKETLALRQQEVQGYGGQS